MVRKNRSGYYTKEETKNIVSDLLSLNDRDMKFHIKIDCTNPDLYRVEHNGTYHPVKS